MSVTFVNYKMVVKTKSCYSNTKKFKAAFAKNISYFVFNSSYHDHAVVQIKSSPDGRVWMNDGLEVKIAPRELIILVPNHFSKYSALAYRSKVHSHPTTLSIWFQMTRPLAKNCFEVNKKQS